jgi:hypothetical protein
MVAGRTPSYRSPTRRLLLSVAATLCLAVVSCRDAASTEGPEPRLSPSTTASTPSMSTTSPSTTTASPTTPVPPVPKTTSSLPKDKTPTPLSPG